MCASFVTKKALHRLFECRLMEAYATGDSEVVGNSEQHAFECGSGGGDTAV